MTPHCITGLWPCFQASSYSCLGLLFPFLPFISVGLALQLQFPTMKSCTTPPCHQPPSSPLHCCGQL